ncbi:hypothetical protein PLESTM_000546500 [Pleodorina starrii]|nr:hypothetical protein PLESTM_000546500 [Pleodorina starrii]
MPLDAVPPRSTTRRGQVKAYSTRNATPAKRLLRPGWKSVLGAALALLLAGLVLLIATSSLSFGTTSHSTAPAAAPAPPAAADTRPAAAGFLAAILTGGGGGDATASGDGDADPDSMTVELLAVREGLYVGEVKLKYTEGMMADFRRRGDLSQAGDELAAGHREVMGRMRLLAEEIHGLDEQTAEMTLSVQTKARDALSELLRAARAISPDLDSREEVFGHLRDAAHVSDQAADEVHQLANRYAQLSKKAHDLQADSVGWLVQAKGRGGSIQHEADRLKALIDKAEKLDPLVLAPAAPPALAELGPPPQPTWLGYVTGSNRVRHESYWRRYTDEAEMYERRMRAREEYRRNVVEAKLLDKVGAHLDDGTALMAGVGDVLDDVMAVLHQVRDHYKHRAKAYRDAVHDFEALCAQDDASHWAALVGGGFGEEVAAAVRGVIARADRSFDSFVGFQSAAQAKRTAVKKELHLQLTRRP